MAQDSPAASTKAQTSAGLAAAGPRRSFSRTDPMTTDAQRELAGFCEWLGGRRGFGSACAAASAVRPYSNPQGGSMRRVLPIFSAPLLILTLTSPAVGQERPYTEGNVVVVSYIRIKPGMFDKYVKYLDTDYKKLVEAQKKQGVIVDYAVFTSLQRDEGDWNMILTVTYKNMAALDDLRDKTESLMTSTLGLSPRASRPGHGRAWSSA